MNRPFIIKFLSGLSNILICLVAVTVVLLRQNWFGKGDTYAFVFWSIPLAVGLAICGETILNLFRKIHFALRLILIIVTSGLISLCWVYFVYLILGPWIRAFSFPIFYLWIIGCSIQLLFLDLRLAKSTEKAKLSKTLFRLLIFPLTLVLTVVVIFFFSYLNDYLTKPMKEIYLIPSDFKGQFRVIYGEQCGTKPTYESGRRVMKIPENGILMIQPKFQAGLVNNEYYLIDKNGNRKKLNELFDYKDRLKKFPGILMGASGSMGGAMPDGSSSSESPLAIHYTDFTVFNIDTIQLDERAEFKSQQHFDSLTNVLVDECR